MHNFQPGDLIELQVPEGYFYLQIICRHPMYPDIFRFLCGIKSKQLNEYSELVQARCPVGRNEVIGMAPLSSMIELGSIAGRRVANCSIPEEFRDFPVFKIPVRDKSGKAIYWWYWDGGGIWQDPNARDWEYPVREILSVKDIVRRADNLFETHSA